MKDKIYKTAGQIYAPEGTDQILVISRCMPRPKMEELLKDLNVFGKNLGTFWLQYVDQRSTEIMYEKYQDRPFFKRMINALSGNQEIAVTIYQGDQETFNNLKQPLRERYQKYVSAPPDEDLRISALHTTKNPEEFHHDLRALIQHIPQTREAFFVLEEAA